MDLVEQLLAEHNTRTSELIDRYVIKYTQLPGEKNLNTLSLFIIQHERTVASEIALASTEALGKLSSSFSIEVRHIEAFFAANVNAAGKWQVQMKKLYDLLASSGQID